jgi:hypothetical protein
MFEASEGLDDWTSFPACPVAELTGWIWVQSVSQNDPKLIGNAKKWLVGSLVFLFLNVGMMIPIYDSNFSRDIPPPISTDGMRDDDRIAGFLSLDTEASWSRMDKR